MIFATARRALSFFAFVLIAISTQGLAQTNREQRLEVALTTEPVLLEDRVVGSAFIDYVVRGEQSQILAVDMLASSPSAYFNVIPTGSDAALFVGSTSGQVADIHLPEGGDYTVRVYLMRSAARRNETADFSLAVGIGPPDFADGLSGGPDFWQVVRLSGGSALNVRSGPATRYSVTGQVRNGEVLQSRGCRLSGEERWCSVRTVGSGVTGWVAGRYLLETAPPRRPQMPPGGPVGNGTPFDATGSVPCNLTGAPEMDRCLIGVIRQGPGNAGVWIAIGGDVERQILFEAGIPVTSNTDAELLYDKDGDLYRIRIGDERFDIPEAVVNGG